MKRINCKEAFQVFDSIPGTATIVNNFPDRVKGWAYISAETGAIGYAETEEAITEACTINNKFLGLKTFFLFSTYGHFHADWTFCGALIAE
ncbi:MAG: hypothetical protein ACI4O4_00810 [Candidatus Ventricola sp.]